MVLITINGVLEIATMLLRVMELTRIMINLKTVSRIQEIESEYLYPL
ncbi:MAG: hypothetical protein SRB1_01400 [Desulfobacteraceae bacterium Eth-SRB1]|nr:MAG: hypothetical protein SRB1_01400 [Desulfobacteraceae bacterium Eth-SRB1]